LSQYLNVAIVAASENAGLDSPKNRHDDDLRADGDRGQRMDGVTWLRSFGRQRALVFECLGGNSRFSLAYFELPADTGISEARWEKTIMPRERPLPPVSKPIVVLELSFSGGSNGCG
jgi:hypothetical protein